jgi:hypothetical protein
LCFKFNANNKAGYKTLDNVESIIEVFGMVNCIDSFKEHSKVLNGASEILNFIFGQNGIHTRVAMGTNSLPFNFLWKSK